MSEAAKAEVIEKVRKILSKTTEQSGCSEAEAGAAFRKASAIMAEHNLSMDEITVKDATDNDESWIEADVFETGRWSLENNLAWGIAKEFFFIEGFFDRKGNQKVLRFFGKRENVETARWVFNSLLASFERLWHHYRITHGVDASERRLFVSGVARGFSDKLREERQAMAMERDIVKGSRSGSTELALTNIQALTEAKYREKHPGGKPSKGHFAELGGSTSTLAAGMAAGRKLNLNRAIGESPGRKKLTGS
jgi:Protein of unknown function (DUF2786)